MEKFNHASRITSHVFLLLLLIGLIGCAGFEIKDSSTHQAIAYASGKAMAIGIIKIVPDADADLGTAWSDMMDRNQGLDMIPSTEILSFYNDSILILTMHAQDPYGLIGDMSAMLMIFGAEFDEEGHMKFIKPVPMPVMIIFEMGYNNGKRVAMN